MADNLAMRRPGTQFTRDGVNLSWPMGGEREVIQLAMDDRPATLKRRIAEGHVVETKDPPTIVFDDHPRVYRLLEGEEARAHKALPAGPVTRFIFQRENGSSARANVQVPHASEEEARDAYDSNLTVGLDNDDEPDDAFDQGLVHMDEDDEPAPEPAVSQTTNEKPKPAAKAAAQKQTQVARARGSNRQ